MDGRTDRQTDTYDEGDSRFSKFCPKNGRMIKNEKIEKRTKWGGKSVMYVKRIKENKFCPSAIFYAPLHEDVWENGSKLFIYVYLFVYMN